MEYCRFLRNLDFYLFQDGVLRFPSPFHEKIHCIITFRNIFIICGEQSIRSEISRSFMRSLAYPAERFFSLKKAFTQIPPYKYRLLFEKTTYFS